jgi:hypothetical protein
MTMLHKAFVFDWGTFETELLPILTAALSEGSIEQLVGFINHDLSSVVDPYEGEPLSEDWFHVLNSSDVHDVGDYALTKYYDPLEDGGVGQAWLKLTDVLSEECQYALLGKLIGPTSNLFDPGKMGSYFQTAEMVRQSFSTLKEQERPELIEFKALLQRSLEAGKGVYVTF